jgi:L-aminopeptidase/D-esterase-like protein
MGVATSGGPVPIVVGAVIFDLMTGDPAVRPTADDGYAACVAARTDDVTLGAVGAGTGATLDKWQGPDAVRPGGLGSSVQRQGDLVVGALIVANPFGGIHDGRRREWIDVKSPVLANTTIGVVATNATLDKVGCLLVAQSAHDGLARALEPVHATMDGDALVVGAVGGVTAPVDQVRLLAARAVEDAVRMVGSA